MPQQAAFAVERRDVIGKKVSRLRRSGIIPGNIYGHNRESIPIQFNAHDFKRFLHTHAATTLLALQLDSGSPETAIIRHVQRDPRTNDIQHVDFFHLEMSEPIKLRVPIRIEGEAPAVKQFDGVLLQLLEYLEVEALPADLPEAVSVDITSMADLKDTRFVRDLRVPANVTVLTDADEAIVKIEPPRIAVEEAAPAAAPEKAAAEEAATPEAATPEAGTEG